MLLLLPLLLLLLLRELGKGRANPRSEPGSFRQLALRPGLKALKFGVCKAGKPRVYTASYSMDVCFAVTFRDANENSCQ